MESYTYLFLFVLQLVFTVVVLLALLYERRLQKQLEKKNKLLLAELSYLREEIQAMTNTHFTFTGKIARISESTMTALDLSLIHILSKDIVSDDEIREGIITQKDFEDMEKAVMEDKENKNEEVEKKVPLFMRNMKKESDEEGETQKRYEP